MYRPQSTNEWAFVGTTAAQAVCSTIPEIYTVLRYFAWVEPEVNQTPASFVVPVNFGFLALGNLYQAILAFDAARTKNSIQMFSIYVLNLFLFVFSVLRYLATNTLAKTLPGNMTMSHKSLVDETVDFWAEVWPALLTTTIIIGVCSVISSILVFLLHREFRWAIYRHINGSVEMFRRYLAYEVLLVLIRIEVYFFIGFIMLYGLIDVHFKQPEFTITMVLIPLGLLHLFLVSYCTRLENTFGAIAAIVLYCGKIAYLISRLINDDSQGSSGQKGLNLTLQLFGCTATAFATLACLSAMFCVTNFRKGLKPLLKHNGWRRTTHHFKPVHQYRYSERIELD